MLKTTGDEVINGWTGLGNLVVGSAAEILGNLSGYSTTNMIKIGGDEETPVVFKKGVHFEDASFHDLWVKQRIGSINVRKNGAFDVLMKRSPHLQVMKGQVTFDEVRLLEPITLYVSQTLSIRKSRFNSEFLYFRENCQILP